MSRTKRSIKIVTIFLLCFTLLLHAQTEADAPPPVTDVPPSVAAETAEASVTFSDDPVVEAVAEVETSVIEEIAVDETPSIIEEAPEVTVDDTPSITEETPEVTIDDTPPITEETPEVTADDTPSITEENPGITVDDTPSIIEDTPKTVETIITVEPVPIPVSPAETTPVIDTDDAPKPKIAVYVTGSKDEVENKALGTYILEALVRSGRYTAIERSEVFLAEIAQEHITQRSGAIDDAQISQLGKQSGVQFVCVADVTKAFGGNQVSVRILDVETAEVVAVGVVHGALRNMDDLRKISEKVVNAMFGIVVVQEKTVRFGARLAYNNSHVLNHTFPVQILDDNFQFINIDYANEFGKGSGFEFGFVTLFRLTGRLSIESGVNFLMRSPVTVTNVADINEFAVTIPALLRYKIGATPVYVQGGAQLDIPFGAKLKRSGETAVDFDERTSFDIGLTAGAGYQILKNLSADIRITSGLLSYDGLKGHLLLQGSAGVSWMF
ncbi:MAG: outer membrane beta-barrel protein [Chitinispirillales bacterium]|jgi:hypothetical protein|nr:outer membrane beta-barrel protein [Chitinispirillales bacterium]